MKNFTFFIALALIVITILLLNPNIAGAQTEIGAIIVTANNNRLQILEGPMENGDLMYYDIGVSGSCTLADFQQGDFLGLTSADYTQLKDGDSINGKISLSNLFAGSKEFTGCYISSPIKKNDGPVKVLFSVYLTGSDYALESADGKEYILQNQNDCLKNNLGNISAIFVSQKSTQISSGDNIILGFKLDFSGSQSTGFNLVELSNCQLGSVSPANSSEAQITEIQTGGKIIAKDSTSFEKLSLQVDSSCKILSKTAPFYGDIIYANSNPIYISSSSADLENLDFSNLSSVNIGQAFTDSVCKITGWSSLGIEYVYERPFVIDNIPDVTNYYIGNYGKKIYTDRPITDDMIGALVKGETDPATYIVDSDGKLRWLKNEEIAMRVAGDDWDSQIVWFNDSIIYTYQFGDEITY